MDINKDSGQSKSKALLDTSVWVFIGGGGGGARCAGPYVAPGADLEFLEMG